MTITGAILLAAIAGALHWKQRVPRLVAWVLLFVGIGAATVVMQFLGGFAQISIYGVGVLAIIALITAIGFWEEAVRRNGLHRVRTPIIAVVLGISLMGVGGTLGASLRDAAQTGGANIDEAITTAINSK